MVERYIVIVDAESSILSNRPIKNYELDDFGIRSGSYATQLGDFIPRSEGKAFQLNLRGEIGKHG